MRQQLRELRHEPIDKRIRAELNGEMVVDSTRAMLVWEPRRVVPIYAVPVEDVDGELAPSAAAPLTSDAPFLHPGIPFAAHTTAGESLDLHAAGTTLGTIDLAVTVVPTGDVYTSGDAGDELDTDGRGMDEQAAIHGSLGQRCDQLVCRGDGDHDRKRVHDDGVEAGVLEQAAERNVVRELEERRACGRLGRRRHLGRSDSFVDSGEER